MRSTAAGRRKTWRLPAKPPHFATLGVPPMAMTTKMNLKGTPMRYNKLGDSGAQLRALYCGSASLVSWQGVRARSCSGSGSCRCSLAQACWSASCPSAA